MEIKPWVRCRKWESPGDCKKWDCLCVILFLGGNVERIFVQLGSGIGLGGAASPRENRIQSGPDVLEKQTAWKLRLFSWSQVQGFMYLRPGWERFHRKHTDCIWPQAECPPSAVSLQSRQMSCGNVWTVTALQFWGVIQLHFILLGAQQENLGCFDTNFTRMGWLERVQSELTEIIPDLEVRKLQRKIERGHRREEGRKHLGLQVWKGRLPRPELQQVRSWLEIWRSADERRVSLPALCAAIPQRMAEKQLSKHPFEHLSALHVLEASSTR